MNAIILINGEDVTDFCLLSATRLATDSTRRISTGEVTVIATTPGALARYDFAHYDEDVYSVNVAANLPITILDGTDGTTKLFEGRITSVDLEQMDSPLPQIWYKCKLNDYGSILDRSVCWDNTYPVAFPIGDHDLITALIGHFAPDIAIDPTLPTLLPTIQHFDWLGKTCRQVMDELATLSTADWWVDFDAVLHYRKPDTAPLAPFSLSTSHDDVTSFKVKVTAFRKDFTNPINQAFVRGATDPLSGTPLQVEYSDPISIGKYGVFQYSLVDTQITNAWDATLRAQSLVLKYKEPIEAGSFTIWKDGLRSGPQVQLTEDALGIDGLYIIRALTMIWEGKDEVRYEAQFGASQPDLETILRLLAQRAVWASSMIPAGIPPPGSVGDGQIVTGGLSAASINSVNASTIAGMINAGQIGSVNAGAIVGTIASTQISSVNATSISGSITAGQIGSVNAASITGVVVSSQLADQIIDDLAKYADRLRPVPMLTTPPSLPHADYPPNTFFYYIPDGHFYQINSAGTSWALNDSPSSALMTFYHIGAISANQIIGLIVAAQINSITAGQITGSITAGQIASVNASAIAGSITASQIGSVNASSITGSITSTQISSVNASAITGTIVSTQIGSINATTITINQIQDSQIGTVSGGKIIAGTVTSDKMSTFSLDVGGGGSKPGVIRVMNAGGGVVANIGTIDSGQYGGWFQVIGAGGTGWFNAKVKTDTGGNLYITDSNFTISASGYTITASPTTFDSTYGSLAMQVADSTNKASLVSRGLVIYNGSSVIGVFARDPSNAGNTQMVLYNSGGTISVLCDGFLGSVRANLFQAGGSPGVTETQTVGGIVLKFVGGIYIGH